MKRRIKLPSGQIVGGRPKLVQVAKMAEKTKPKSYGIPLGYVYECHLERQAEYSGINPWSIGADIRPNRVVEFTKLTAEVKLALPAHEVGVLREIQNFAAPGEVVIFQTYSGMSGSSRANMRNATLLDRKFYVDVAKQSMSLERNEYIIDLELTEIT